ncbi:MAG TPA: carotenoid biosynthesis protein [Bryobacteraceae bacterium]|nr:carotenoid biosynthesis protein [Bryobacteraceae bacterium]
MLAIVAMHVFPPAVFALIHGRRFYGTRGILTFFGICLIVGNLFENLGILTGFPFGRYYFTAVMGPKLLHVPVLLGLAYVGMGYLSWTLGRLILRNTGSPLTGSHVVTLPLLAAFIMVAWDLSMDPVWSTIEHGWIWLNGGAYFGVPLVNFFGWYLTVYVIYQSFALYLRDRATTPGLPSSYWPLAVLFYGISAAGNILLLIPVAGPTLVTDATGAQWKVSDITGVCASVSIFTMGAFAMIAAWRGHSCLPRRDSSRRFSPPSVSHIARGD